MVHGLIAMAWCVLCVLLHAPWPFYFWPAAFYFGREHAQAEERYLKDRNLKRSLAPWWIGFHPSAWTAKGFIDFLLPLAVALATWAGQVVTG